MDPPVWPSEGSTPDPRALYRNGFLNALIVPRVDKTYNAVFDLTPVEFDACLTP
jgi:hypothetical protein